MKIPLIITIITLCSIWTIQAKSVVKTFLKKQAHYENPQYLIRNKTEIETLIQEREKPETEKEDEIQLYILKNADKLEILIAMDSPEGLFGEFINQIFNNLNKKAETDPDLANKVSFSYHLTTDKGDTLTKTLNLQEWEKMKIQQKTNDRENKKLLRTLLSDYDNLITVQEDKNGFTLYSKQKKKKTTHLLLETHLKGMYILTEITGKWNTDKLTEIFSDEEGQNAIKNIIKTE